MIVAKVSKSAAGAMFQYVSRCNSDTFQVSEMDSRQIEKASPFTVFCHQLLAPQSRAVGPEVLVSGGCRI